MRYALVDNATLQSAMRLEGRAPMRSKSTMTGDILALENLLQAILFYDKTLYINNGSIQNQKETKSFLDRFYEVTLDKGTYQQIVSMTNQIADDLIPCIEGGKFTQDDIYWSYFNFFNLQLGFGWEKKRDKYQLGTHFSHKSSAKVPFLYEEPLNMIFAELSDKSFCKDINERIPLLYDSNGQIINVLYKINDKQGKEYCTKIAPQTAEFFNAMNALTFRSVFYTLAGRGLGADIILNPMRSKFQINCLFRKYLYEEEAKSLEKAERMLKQREKMQDCTYFDIDIPAMTAHQLPMFTLWIAENTKEGASFIDTAFELKDRKDFALLRLHISEIKEMIEMNQKEFLKFAQSMSLELNRQMCRIREKYRLKTGENSLYSTHILLANIDRSSRWLPVVPEFQCNIKPKTSDINISFKEKFGIISRCIKEDLLQLDKLNDLYGSVTSKVIFGSEYDTRDIRIEKASDPGRLNRWTHPM